MQDFLIVGSWWHCNREIVPSKGTAPLSKTDASLGLQFDHRVLKLTGWKSEGALMGFNAYFT